MTYNNIKHILIVDDDDRIRELLSKYLRDNDYYISVAKNADKALNLMHEFEFDLMILDVMMPGTDGYTLAEMIRKNSNTPIIMLTAMSEIDDKIKGFEIGVNDFLTKPFEPKELLFRIKNILNMSNNISERENNKYVKFGNFKYDLVNNRLTKNDIAISLTSGENKLLNILIKSKSQIISREELSNLCGGINERSIDVQIIRLRNKIEDNPKNPYFLQTIRGEGYIFYN